MKKHSCKALWMQEVKALAALGHHPHVVGLVAVWPCHIVMDDVGERDLWALLHCLPMADRVRLLVQVADGLAYIHARGYVHGDIKLENVAVCARTNTAVIIDLESAVPVDKAATSLPRFTREYQAPEGGDASAAGDCYALGVLCAEMILGQARDEDMSSCKQFARMVAAGAPPWCIPVVTPLLERDPKMRGNAADAKIALAALIVAAPWEASKNR